LGKQVGGRESACNHKQHSSIDREEISARCAATWPLAEQEEHFIHDMTPQIEVPAIDNGF